MNKRIYLMILVLLLVIPGVMAQTVQIHNDIEVPGSIQVQVDMLNYTDVGAITLKIDYDVNLMTFTGITNTSLTGSWFANAVYGQIAITYQATPLLTGYPINGKLLDLNFNYTGGFSSPLAFTNDCEIVNSSLANVPSVFIDGSVSNNPNMSTYTGVAGFLSGYANVGDALNWPLILQGNPAIPGAFQTINSLTFHVSYDPVKLTYNSFVGNPAYTGYTVTGGGGNITIAWSSATPKDFSSVLLMDLNFTYNGGGEAFLSFEPGSVVTSGTTIQNTYFVSGSVNVDPGGPFDGSMTISQVASTMGTNDVNVPVIASGLASQSVGAISFKMNFDPAELTYKGYTANQFTGWVVNQSPVGTLNFIKTSPTALSIANGALVTLKFDYKINTQADIVFVGGTSLQTTSFGYITTDFVDGFISTNYTLTATAGAHGALAAVYTGSYFWGTVVPIEGVPNTGYEFFNWTGTGAAFIADVLDATTTVTIPASNIAVQANFAVDPAQFFDLTLTLGTHGTAVTGDGSYNVEHVQAITATAATGYRFLNWTGTGSAYVTSLTSASTNVTMPALAIGLTANFEVDPAQTFALTLTLGANGSAVTGDGSYNVEYVQAITATPAAGYHFVNWTGTGAAYVADVNSASTSVTMPAMAIGLTANFAGYSVSGKLKYASVDVRPISSSTVNLKLSFDNSTFATTTTDINGDFSFANVPATNFYLEASTIKAWAGTDIVDFDDILDAYDFYVSGTPNLTGLFFLAGDVNESASIDMDDVLDIYDAYFLGLTTPTWAAPSWIFESPNFTVVGSNIVVDINGICSGDVNASFNPIP